MNKKILITLLLITSLILFLGCTNLGLEVTCPDGQLVNDILDCVNNDSNGTPIDPELKDEETPKASQSQTCVPLWTEATYPRRVIALPAWHSMNYECSSCNSRYTNAGMRDCCSTEQRIVVYETPGDISSPFIHIKGAWCQIQYGPPSAPPQPPANHPYCERCYGNATTDNSSKCFDPKTGGNGNVSGWTEVNCDILSSRGTTCADSSCATTCAANDGDSANCSSGSNPNSLRSCNRASGDHRIEGFKCECACSPESDSGYAPPRPDFTGTAKIAVTFSKGVDETYDGMKLIYDCDDLQAMNNYLAGDYILGNDIDCTDTRNWYTMSRSGIDIHGFEPIGTRSYPFTGTFNGNKQKITGLYISISTGKDDDIGLFGTIENARIKNVGLIDNEIYGSGYDAEYVKIGGLVGSARNSEIINNFTTGRVGGIPMNSTNLTVGGLIGFLDNGVVTNNYVTGNSNGDYAAGGLIGEVMNGEVRNNYVNGIASGDNSVGGLIGVINLGTITNNYATSENLQSGYSQGTLIGTAYSPAYITNNISIVDYRTSASHFGENYSGEDLNANNYGIFNQPFGFSESYWLPFGILDFDDSWMHINNNLPELTSQLCPKYGGLQELDGKKVVCSCEDLQNINLDVSADYLIGDNLACSNTINWNNGKGFQPIATFTGTLNGNNNTINDLFINRPTEFKIGLFASIQNAKITKINLENANITGSTDVGTIAGRSTTSTLENISITGNIHSTSTTQLTRTGGIIGYATVGNTQISYSSFNGTVTSNGGAVGGIVGVLDGGTIIGSHTTGTITGAHNYAGGITSYVNWTSSITDSYSTASVTGRKYVGGLVGTIDKEGTNAIINSFSTGAVTGTQYVGGLIGEHYRSGETITNNYYNNTADNPSTCIGIGTGDCITITNNETYFYDMNNQPMVSWVFRQLWVEDINYYPIAYKETENFLPLTVGTAAELGDFANDLIPIEDAVATVENDEDIHCCVLQKMEQTQNKSITKNILYKWLVWKNQPHRWWKSPKMPWNRQPASPGNTKDVCVGMTLDTKGMNDIISPTQVQVDNACDVINEKYPQNVATECLKVTLNARSSYNNGPFKPCRVVKQETS